MEPELLPCPLCGEALLHVESEAKSFDPPRLYHEYHHPRNECPVGKSWYFSDDPVPRVRFIETWNRRAALSTSDVPEPVLTGPELFEIFFNVTKDGVPEELSDKIFDEAAETINRVFVHPVPAASPQTEARKGAIKDLARIEFEKLWADMDKSHEVPHDYLDRLSDLIDEYLPPTLDSA